MTIEVHWTVDERPLADDKVCQAVSAALAYGGRPGISASVVLLDDRSLAEMHGAWLADASETDVMAFDLEDEHMDGPAVEIFVSVDRARVVAEERGVSLARELALYLVHGSLHLCGFDDHEEEDRQHMRAAESEVLRSLGYPDDLLPHDR